MSEEVVSDTPGTVVSPETDLPTIAIPTSSRVRARFARFGGRTAANPVLEPLLRSVRTTHPKADLSIIERAYAVAEQAHEGQMRKSGDPYITHPLAVATILAELGMTPDTLAAALLHDTIEDTEYSLGALSADFGEQIKADLEAARIKAVVTGRPKHYYSVYQKMIVRGRDFDEIYDLVAVRVLVDSMRDCYAVLGALHARWNPVPGRFKDYIAMPKFNMYQSLHTTVMGPLGRPVEIQIRTHTMHRRAEYGVAAHWKYKEDAPREATGAGRTGHEGDLGPVNDMAWLRQLLDWQRETSDPGEFLDSLRFEISANEVYVFTPKGSVVALPAGSTTVDFAYAVHTEVGHHCIGGRVNGRLVPLESPLENGDVVEILTSKANGASPSRDWLTFVRSPRARNKIRQWFSKERREEAIDAGKDDIAKAMRKQGLPLQRLMTHGTLTGLASELRYPDISSLYAAVGEGHVSAQHVVGRLVASLGGEEGASEDLAAEG